MRAERWWIVAGVLALGAAACGGSDGKTQVETTTHGISGAVTGEQVEGVRVTLGGAAESSTLTDAAGHFAFAALADGDYTVTPAMAGCTFDPASAAVTLAGADGTANFVCTAEVAAGHAIQGTVTGAVQEGVTVTLGGAASASATTDVNGHYAFASLADGDYTVTPSRTSYTFDPAAAEVTLAGADRTADFVATAETPGPYAIEGVIIGDVQAGISVTLSGKRSRQVVTLGDGRFRFDGLPAGQYVVTATLGHWWIQGSPWPLEIVAKNPDTLQLRVRIGFTQYMLAGGQGSPANLVVGPDGAIWFTDGFNKAIGRITMDGAITEYPLPTAGAVPHGLVAGPDGGGALWYIDDSRHIGRITTAGVMTEYSMPPDPEAGNYVTTNPTAIVVVNGFLYYSAAKDGFTDSDLVYHEPKGVVGRCTTAGSCEELDLDFTGHPADLALGPNSDVWFAENMGMVGKVVGGAGRVEYKFWDEAGSAAHVLAGPDGNMWFTHANNGKLSKVSVDGTLLAEYDLAGQLGDMLVRGDGSLWVTQPYAGYVRVDPSTGVVTTRYTLHAYLGEDLFPGSFVEGPDGALWCASTVSGAAHILRLTPP